MSPPQFQLVLPCYNEAKSIERVVRRTIAAATAAGFSNDRFRAVIVENGSRDDSRAVLNTLKGNPELGPWFEIVPIDVNAGYGFGLWQGLRSTTAPIVGWSHADEQCDPADAFRGYAIVAAASSPTLVKGVRRGRSFKECLISRVFETIASFYLRHWFYEINAQPKVFPRALIDADFTPPNDFAFDVYALFRAFETKYAVRTIAVDFPPRVHGLSNWASSLRSRSKHIANMIRYIRGLAKERKRA